MKLTILLHSQGPLQSRIEQHWWRQMNDVFNHSWWLWTKIPTEVIKESAIVIHKVGRNLILRKQGLLDAIQVNWKGKSQLGLIVVLFCFRGKFTQLALYVVIVWVLHNLHSYLRKALWIVSAASLAVLEPPYFFSKTSNCFAIRSWLSS